MISETKIETTRVSMMKSLIPKTDIRLHLMIKLELILNIDLDLTETWMKSQISENKLMT